MTPSGVHVNKTAIAVIIGILILIVIGFKYKGGAIVSFDEKGNKGVDLKKEKEREEILKTKEEEKLKTKEEFNKYEGTLVQNMHEVCYHVYHLECINKWIRSCHESGWEKTCPLCRVRNRRFRHLVYVLG